MEPKRWERIKQLFDSAMEKEPGRRAEFLRHSCAGDESLCAEVESMLARHAKSPDFLESPTAEAEPLSIAAPFSEVLPKPGPASPVRPPLWMYILAGAFLLDALLRIYCSF
jgi:hypothetical protein